MEKKRTSSGLKFALPGILAVAVIMIIGTIWMGRSASRDTEKAVRSVSLLYLDELAGRREKVVEENLNDTIRNLRVAVSLMTDEDLSDTEHLQAYQARMKQLYVLEKFAFVDETGLIHTSLGTQTNIEEYAFDYQTLREPEISIKDLKSENKKVIIAVPIDRIPFEGHEFLVCFMEIDMNEMLQGVSMKSADTDATFCNIYTSEGIALSNVVLGGLATEDNLLDAFHQAQFEEGFSAQTVRDDFSQGRKGTVSFVYNGIRETLTYVPINGTDWFLTYLIQESIISDSISSISRGIIGRSLTQSALTAAVLLLMFAIMIMQNWKSSQLALEKETQEAESRIKQEELEQRLALQSQLLEQEKQRAQQDSMITALASDYRSVYYVNLDKDEGVCYRSDHKLKTAPEEGKYFAYLKTFTNYAQKYVTEAYREGFLKFIEPQAIREALEKEDVIVYRYLTNHEGKEFYEMLRMAGVRHAQDRTDHMVHAIGLGFANIDQEMRESMAKNQALEDALRVAENANRAKTAFLSNMSHEIRTPMNAIIGLDNIALSEEGISETTRGHLEKIGNSAHHLLNLINDILDMSRIESGRLVLKKEEFSFPKLIEQVNTIFSGQCADKGLSYDCQVKGDVNDFYIGDSMKLKQVLINILGNAVKFTPEGGRVTFDVERTAQFDGKSALRFTIADTGIGMSEDYLPHIFDTFSQEDSTTTSKYGSSGLGMSITKNIVEMMNGAIEVQSEKGKGSAFVVTVTLMDSHKKALAGDEIEIKPEDLNVLVVDDDPIACEHARLVLEKVGVSSDVAHSGPEAVEMVRLRHARRDPYKLILVDWKMPEMDGVETTRQIRSIVGNESAIIILTAYRWEDVLDEATQAGVDSFLAKPLFASSVLEEFKEALRKKNLNAVNKVRKADLAGRRILLAEDMVVNAEIMIMLLQMKEIQADHAENGKIAVEMFASCPEDTYDAILMDMRMPEMDGLEATMAIRAMDRADAKKIPIIALTANAFDEDVQRSLQAGLNAHLSKPVEPENLFDTLASLIAAAENA